MFMDTYMYSKTILKKNGVINPKTKIMITPAGETFEHRGLN